MSRSESVRVVVRCRPMNGKETSLGCQSCVVVDRKTRQIVLQALKDDRNEERTFAFDAVYGSDSSQKSIYDESARPIIDGVLDGYNGTIFAYGQTGAGKTYTMSGIRDDEEEKGIIFNAFDHIFGSIQESEKKQFLVRVSYLEIYNEEVRDLLSRKYGAKLKLKETKDSGVYVDGLSKYICKSVDEISRIMEVGQKNRHVGETKMNLESSRSHTIFTIIVECSEEGEDGEQHIRMGKLNLVDLAGSESVSKTGAEGERLKEGININKSLTSLGNVIAALVDGKSTYIPYRDSRLTRLLQDSLGGNTKTVMVANVSPADYNRAETLSTLRYANRAKNIKNKPRINEDPKDAMIREFQEEIFRLRALLEQRQEGAGAGAGAGAILEGGVGDDREGGGHEAAIAPMSDEKLEMLKRENEEELKRVLQEKNMAEEEKLLIARELEHRHEELERERQQRGELAAKLKAMTETVMHGGVNLLDKAKEQEMQLRRQQAELDDQRRKEEMAHDALAEKEEELQLAKDKFSSLEEEVQIKTKKLKKQYKDIKRLTQEVEDMKEEFQRERERLTQQVQENEKEVKLRELIIKSFIPEEELQKIMDRSSFNEETGEWIVRNIQLAGNMLARRPGAAMGRRPVSDFGEQRLKLKSRRRRGGPKISLDLPDRQTSDYERRPSSHVDLSFMEEEGEEEERDGDVVFFGANGMPGTFFTYSSPSKRTKKKHSRKKKSGSGAEKEGAYPEARGLVDRQVRVV